METNEEAFERRLGIVARALNNRGLMRITAQRTWAEGDEDGEMDEYTEPHDSQALYSVIARVSEYGNPVTLREAVRRLMRTRDDAVISDSTDAAKQTFTINRDGYWSHRCVTYDDDGFVKDESFEDAQDRTDLDEELENG